MLDLLLLGGAAGGLEAAGWKGGHVGGFRGKANWNGMECCVALQLIQCVRVNGRLGKVHLNAESSTQTLGALNHRVEPLEAGGGHSTGRCDLDLFAVNVDANNYGELVAGQCTAFHLCCHAAASPSVFAECDLRNITTAGLPPAPRSHSTYFCEETVFSTERPLSGHP